MAFCVRNQLEDLIFAEFRSIELCSALEAEVKEFRLGLMYCVNHNMSPLNMETDSLIIKKVLEGIWEIPWAISVNIRDIERTMENKEVEVVYTYREGNKLIFFN